jgi:hypothetical protein
MQTPRAGFEALAEKMVFALTGDRNPIIRSLASLFAD